MIEFKTLGLAECFYSYHEVQYIFIIVRFKKPILVVDLYLTFLHISACFKIHLQLILTVRPSPPPHNPSNVFGSFADSYTGNVGSSSNLDGNTMEVLKVRSLFQMLLFPAVFDCRRMRS